MDYLELISFLYWIWVLNMAVFVAFVAVVKDSILPAVYWWPLNPDWNKLPVKGINIPE